MLAKRNPVIYTAFLLYCGLKADRSFKPRQSSGLPVARCVPFSVGKILEVFPCDWPLERHQMTLKVGRRLMWMLFGHRGSGRSPTSSAK